MTAQIQRARPKPVTPRPASLLATLFGRVGILFLLIVVSAGLATFVAAQRRVDEAYDGQLIIGANVLLALMSDELKEAAAKDPADSTELQVDDAPLLSAEDRLAFDRYAEWRMFRVWLGPKMVLQSDTGPAEGAPPSKEGFSTLMAGKEPWRVFTLRVPSRGVSIEVGERQAIRLVLVRGIVVGLAVPLLLLIPAAAFLIWIALKGGLSALRLLFAEIGRRSMRDMSSLPLEPWPKDLHPLIRSINLLFDRIDRSLHQERRFLDDAAIERRQTSSPAHRGRNRPQGTPRPDGAPYRRRGPGFDTHRQSSHARSTGSANQRRRWRRPAARDSGGHRRLGSAGREARG
jgi:hypothetical protein